MTYMGHEKPTAFQKQVAAALGIDISHDTQEVAAARIHTLRRPRNSFQGRPVYGFRTADCLCAITGT